MRAEVVFVVAGWARALPLDSGFLMASLHVFVDSLRICAVVSSLACF